MNSVSGGWCSMGCQTYTLPPSLVQLFPTAGATSSRLVLLGFETRPSAGPQFVSAEIVKSHDQTRHRLPLQARCPLLCGAGSWLSWGAAFLNSRNSEALGAKPRPQCHTTDKQLGSEATGRSRNDLRNVGKPVCTRTRAQSIEIGDTFLLQLCQHLFVWVWPLVWIVLTCYFHIGRMRSLLPHWEMESFLH